jgi:hypothetical protein
LVVLGQPLLKECEVLQWKIPYKPIVVVMSRRCLHLDMGLKGKSCAIASLVIIHKQGSDLVNIGSTPAHAIGPIDGDRDNRSLPV